MKKITTIILVLVAVFLAGCDYQQSTQKAGEQEQEDVMQRARDQYPTPYVEEFLTRRAVVKWMERMDQPGKIFYIYIMSDVGTITHYFVAEYRPTSVGTYLTPTMRREYGSNGSVALPTNALDGTYYGMGGGSDQYFFFDAETDAYIELKGLNYIVSDQPFETEAPHLTFVSKD